MKKFLRSIRLYINIKQKLQESKEKGLDKVVGLEDENEAGPSLIPDKDDIYNENSGEKSQDDEDSITKKMENCD